MTYNKEYTIKKKEIYPNYIRFKLDDYVRFGDGNYNFIFCLNELPFKNYQVEDKIEISLTDAIGMSSQSYHQGIVRGISQSIPEDIMMDDSLRRDDEEINSGMMPPIHKQLSAYKKQTVHELFRLSLEWLEKYIEVAYPNYKTRKQIHDNNIRRQDANDPSKIENMFAGSLFGFKSILEMAGKPKFLCDEVKQEYYKCLDAKGIDVNNCPPRLEHFLFEINEILEGRGEKFERDAANRRNDIDPNSVEYQKAVNEVFTYIQSPLEDARNDYESLKGKNHKDVKFENNFESDGKQAEQAFKQMAGQHDYQGFHFFPQKELNPDYNPLIDDPSEEFLSSNPPTGSSNTVQPSNPQLNVSYLTGQELKDNYAEVRNEGQLSHEQLGEIRRVEGDFFRGGLEVPYNTAIPTAGGLAFVLASSGGILWFKKKIG